MTKGKRGFRFSWKWLVGILVILNGFFVYRWQVDKAEQVVVIRVIDGDTFVSDKKQSVRLLGVEAPEPEYCGGKEAKQRLEELVLDKVVFIKESLAGKYGRVMSIVFVGGVNVNNLMIAEGYAGYDRATCEYCEELKRSQEESRNKMLGVFSDKCYQKTNPQDASCTIKGNVNKSDGNKVYHFPGCGRYEEIVVEKFRGEEWFCSEKEALKAGYSRSKNCFDKKYIK